MVYIYYLLRYTKFILSSYIQYDGGSTGYLVLPHRGSGGWFFPCFAGVTRERISGRERLVDHFRYAGLALWNEPSTGFRGVPFIIANFINSKCIEKKLYYDFRFSYDDESYEFCALSFNKRNNFSINNKGKLQ